MKNKIIILPIIMLVYGCISGEVLFKETIKNTKTTVIALEEYGPGYHYVCVQKKLHNEFVYFFILDCKDKGRDGFQAKKDDISDQGDWIAVTDTTSAGYFLFGEMIFKKTDMVSFKPLREEEKQWFLKASEKIKSDSCLYYNISKIIGFVKPIK